MEHINNKGKILYSDGKPLTAAMDNVLASKLGQIALESCSPEQKVGDSIDRGLILLRLLKEKGFEVFERQEA